MTEQKYEELMKDFFFQKPKKKTKKLALPRKIFHCTERRCWQRKGQWTSSLTFCAAEAKEHHPGLEASVSGQRQAQCLSQSSRWSSVGSYSGGSQMQSTLHIPLVPRKKSSSTETRHVPSEPCFSLHPSLPYLSNVSK